MKQFVGILMIIGGIMFGLYVGLWLGFIGGIVQLINEIKSPHAIIKINIAWGIIKIIFAGLFGWVAGLFFVIPGIIMTKN